MICKWTEANEITFEAHGTKKVPVQGEITTKFYIFDYIKGIKDSKKKYWVTVFEDIDLEDGDRVKILDFDQLVTSQNPKDKRLMQFISAVVSVIKRKNYTPKEKPQDNPYES